MVKLEFVLFVFLLNVIETRHIQYEHQMKLPTWQQIQKTKQSLTDKLIGQPYNMLVQAFNNRKQRNKYLTSIQDNFNETKINQTQDSGVVGWVKSKATATNNLMKSGVKKVIGGVKTTLDADYHPIDWSMQQIQKGKSFIYGIFGLKKTEVQKTKKVRKVVSTTVVIQPIDPKSQNNNISKQKQQSKVSLVTQKVQQKKQILKQS